MPRIYQTRRERKTEKLDEVAELLESHLDYKHPGQFVVVSRLGTLTVKRRTGRE